MANIDTSSKNSKKRSKPERKTLRVDFTPMVDMNMLLITFFMFCTTLSIPQVMDLAMPTTGGETLIPQSKTVTVLLGEQDKVFYYEGIANYEDYTSLKEANYLDLRKVLLGRNASVVAEIQDLKQKYYKKQITEEEYKFQTGEAKKSKDGLIVVVKPTKDSNYKNLVDILDEMQMCGIDKYSIIDITEGDHFLIENLDAKGSLTAMATIR